MNEPLNPSTTPAGGVPADAAPPPADGTPAEDAQATSQLPMLPPQMDKYVTGFLAWVERVNGRCDALVSYVAPRNTEEDMAPENLSRTSVVFGLLIFGLLFGVFGLWSVIAPIDSAAIAPGKVVLDSSKKTIDHLEGGIVDEILVAEGDEVKEGQPLIRLDDTAPRARFELYRGQFITAKATESRLLAERDNRDELTFPASLREMAKAFPDVEANMDSQTRLFKSRRKALEGRVKVLGQKIKQSEEEIKGLSEQIDSANKQLGLLNEEIRDVRHLFKGGNAPKSRLLALERRAAEIIGEKGERQAMISRSNQQINEAKIEMYNVRTQFLNEVMDELKETQSRLSDLEQQMRASEDIVNRIVIKAPIAGEVTGLKVHTVGGVISPAAPIMDIVPFDDKLIVEAKVSPQDIESVRKGLLARVRLVAYKMRSVPPVEGIVETVSADRFEDQRTGESYFTARIAIEESQLEDLGEKVELSPGMPAEVLIITGSRTLFGYLIAPIRDSFNKSFREQ